MEFVFVIAASSVFFGGGVGKLRSSKASSRQKQLHFYTYTPRSTRNHGIGIIDMVITLHQTCPRTSRGPS